MIYLKRFNPFLMFYLISTGVFILYWMEKTIIELGINTTSTFWYIRAIGITLIIGVFKEMFGYKRKEEEKENEK